MYVWDCPPSPSFEDGCSHGTSKACEQTPMLVLLNSFLANEKAGRLLAVLLFCLKSPQNLCKFKVSKCQFWSWSSRCVEGRKEWLTWTSSDEYSRLPAEGITQSTRRCKSALCQRAAPLPVLCDPAQLPQSTWMSPRMEAGIMRPGAGNTGGRGSREPVPGMQKNRCLYQKSLPYWLAGSWGQSNKITIGLTEV